MLVDVTPLNKDLVAQGGSRLMFQFSRSFLVNCFLSAVIEEEQELHNAVINALDVFQLDNATNINLDVWGRIVGQPRISLNAEQRVFFGFDNRGRFDSTPWFSDGAALFGDLPALDSEFRRLIFSKIFKNHVHPASVPELIRFVQLFNGLDVSFVRVGPMELCMTVPTDITLGQLTTLLIDESDGFIEQRTILPLPVTARITKILSSPAGGFGFDGDQRHFDTSRFSVGFTTQQLSEFT